MQFHSVFEMPDNAPLINPSGTILAVSMQETWYMQIMPDISILADATTGKLIQRYLNMDSVAIESLPIEMSGDHEPVSLYIIDVSGIRGKVSDTIARISASTGCARFVLIAPMEDPILHGELTSLRQGHRIDTLTKPIKLSELKLLVERNAEPPRTILTADGSENSIQAL
jgi:hypothetical protein